MPKRDRGGDSDSAGTLDWAGRVRSRREALTAAEAVVADFILDEPERVVFMTALELAGVTRTSDATVIRSARALGYKGFAELKHAIGESMMRTVDPTTRMSRRLSLPAHASGGSVLSTIVDELKERLDETERRLDVDTFEQVVDVIDTATAVATFGVGTSRVCADYLAIRLGRIGIRSRAMTQMGFALADELLVVGDEVAVLFCPGRAFTEVEVVLARMHENANRTVVITDSFVVPEAYSDVLVLHASLSPGGLTGETFAAMAVSDALTLAVASRSPERATSTSEKLTTLRADLVPHESPARTRARRH